jgi:hypothetical protein
MKHSILNVLKHTVFGCLLCIGALLSGQQTAHASESAASDYFPGAWGTFAAAVAPDPGFQFANQTLYYHAKIDKAVIRGRVDLSLKATAVYNYFAGFYTLAGPVLGGKLQLGAAVPVGYVSLNAGIDTTLLGSHSVSDHNFNIGDSMISGALYWQTGDFHFKLNQFVIAPTGNYSTSNLANIGRNYWAFDTSCALTWLSMKTGTEITVLPGIMFNTENSATDYKTGNEFHVDFMLNQFLAKNFALGAQGYYYKQVTGDSGSGAKLGDFEGESYGFGPALLWQPGFDNGKLTLIAKWLFDSHHENHMKGDWGQLVIAKNF